MTLFNQTVEESKRRISRRTGIPRPAKSIKTGLLQKDGKIASTPRCDSGKNKVFATGTCCLNKEHQPCEVTAHCFKNHRLRGLCKPDQDCRKGQAIDLPAATDYIKGPKRLHVDVFAEHCNLRKEVFRKSQRRHTISQMSTSTSFPTVLTKNNNNSSHAYEVKPRKPYSPISGPTCNRLSLTLEQKDKLPSIYFRKSCSCTRSQGRKNAFNSKTASNSCIPLKPSNFVSTSKNFFLYPPRHQCDLMTTNCEKNVNHRQISSGPKHQSSACLDETSTSGYKGGLSAALKLTGRARAPKRSSRRVSTKNQRNISDAGHASSNKGTTLTCRAKKQSKITNKRTSKKDKDCVVDEHLAHDLQTALSLCFSCTNDKGACFQRLSMTNARLTTSTAQKYSECFDLLREQLTLKPHCTNSIDEDCFDDDSSTKQRSMGEGSAGPAGMFAIGTDDSLLKIARNESLAKQDIESSVSKSEKEETLQSRIDHNSQDIETRLTETHVAVCSTEGDSVGIAIRPEDDDAASANTSTCSIASGNYPSCLDESSGHGSCPDRWCWSVLWFVRGHI